MSPSLKMRCGTALMAGVGGIMPSLSKLGSVFVTNPSTPLPEIGLYVGLFIFFFIGVTVCVGFQEWRLREAFVLGICGPALIINILSGVSEGGE